MNKSIKSKATATRATVTFHTSTEVKQRLDKLAIATRRSKSFLTNDAVLRYLSEEEKFATDVKAGLAEADAGLVVESARVVQYLQSRWTDTPLPEPKP